MLSVRVVPKFLLTIKPLLKTRVLGAKPAFEIPMVLPIMFFQFVLSPKCFCPWCPAVWPFTSKRFRAVMFAALPVPLQISHGAESLSAVILRAGESFVGVDISQMPIEGL
jgi:hypothetical protein